MQTLKQLTSVSKNQDHQFISLHTSPLTVHVYFTYFKNIPHQLNSYFFFFYSSGPVSMTIYLANYWVVVLHSRTAATRSLDAVPLYVKLLLYSSVIIYLAPLSPPSKIPPGPPPYLDLACYLYPSMASPPYPLGVYFADQHQQRWSPDVRLSALPTDFRPMPCHPWMPAQRPDD